MKPLPFERQPGETEKAFAAFNIYLNLGPTRSLSQVTKLMGKNTRRPEIWSRKFDWTSRVQAYTAHLARIERETAEAMVRSKSVDWLKRQHQQRDDEWDVRNELIETAREALRRWKSRPDRCGSLEGIARLLELASKLGRLASGMATDKTEITGEDGSPIQIELQAALKKVYGEVIDVETIPTSQPKLPLAAPNPAVRDEGGSTTK